MDRNDQKKAADWSRGMETTEAATANLNLGK